MLGLAFIESAPWVTPTVIGAAGVAIAWQVRRHLAFSLIALQLFLLLVVTWGAYRIEIRQDNQQKTSEEIAATQERLEHERVVRSRVQSEINRYVCTENNKQDRILAGLIEVSLGGQSSFGTGLDLRQLTKFEFAVVKAINRVQELTEANGDSELRTAFQKALRALQEETPCTTVVQAFLAASTTDDLKAVREVLKRASEKSDQGLGARRVPKAEARK